MNIQNEIITCPLNPIHKVKRSSMPYHLIRCKQQIGHDKIEVCMYNSSHIWLKGKGSLQKHMAECPDRAVSLQGSAIMLAPQEPPKTGPETEQKGSGWGDGDEEDWGAGPTPEKPLDIQIGRSLYSYKQPAVRRQMRKDQLEQFKARQSSDQN